MCHFRTLSTSLVLRISQVPLPFHNSIENTAVIALWGTKIGPAGRIVSKWRQHLIRIVFRITALRTTSVQKWSRSSHSGTAPTEFSRKKTLSCELPPLFRALVFRLLPRSFELFRFIIRTAVRLDLVESEPFFPLGRGPNVLSAVGRGTERSREVGCSSRKKKVLESKTFSAWQGLRNCARAAQPRVVCSQMAQQTYRRKIVRKRGNSSCSGSNASMTTRSIGPKM